MLRERRAEVLAANDADVEAATGRLDEGTLDRLRLDDGRMDVLGARSRRRRRSSRSSARSAARTLANGLVVSRAADPDRRRSARTSRRGRTSRSTSPGQLLKSLNAGVLRTGGAALRTVTALVDDVLRPALEGAGLPPAAVGLVRSADREGARVLVSMPSLVPLVILRGSGPSTAELARLAAQNGVRTLAHAEGGGVLYVHAAASPREGARRSPRPASTGSASATGSTSRSSTAAAEELLEPLLELFRAKGLDVRGDVPGASRSTRRSATSGRAIPSASRPSRSRSSTGSSEALRIANDGDVRACRPGSSPRTPGRPSVSSTAIAARPRSGTRRRGSPTGSS